MRVLFDDPCSSIRDIGLRWISRYLQRIAHSNRRWKTALVCPLDLGARGRGFSSFLRGVVIRPLIHCSTAIGFFAMSEMRS